MNARETMIETMNQAWNTAEELADALMINLDPFFARPVTVCKPGDYLVLHVEGDLTLAESERIRATVRLNFPDIGGVVVAAGLKSIRVS